MTELENKIDTANKQLSIVCSLWALLFAIPIFFIPQEYIPFSVIGWMVIVIIGVLLSPKICNLIWREKYYDNSCKR